MAALALLVVLGMAAAAALRVREEEPFEWAQQVGPAPPLAPAGGGAYFDDGTTEEGWRRAVASKLPPWPASAWASEGPPVPGGPGSVPRAAVDEYLGQLAPALLGEGARAVRWRAGAASVEAAAGAAGEQLWRVELRPACFHRPGQARAWCADIAAELRLAPDRWRYETLGARVAAEGAGAALHEQAFALRQGPPPDEGARWQRVQQHAALTQGLRAGRDPRP